MAKYGVFIIEFLREGDYNEGDNLNEILKLSRIPAKYLWVDTEEELQMALAKFNSSNFRYLYISCHADNEGFELNGNSISNLEFKRMSDKYLKNKRVFISACRGANRELASYLIVGNGAYSLIGTPTDVDFDKAALFWPSFFHLINEIDANKMRRVDIINITKKLVQLFDIPIHYYSKIKNEENFIRRVIVKPSKVDNRKIKISVKPLFI